MFENKNSKKIEYLEDERKKLWERVELLEEKISIRPSDYEKEAKQASRKAAEFRNKTEERLSQAQELLAEIKSVRYDVTTQKSEVSSIRVNLDELQSQAKTSTDEITNRSENLLKHVERIQDIFNAHPNLKSEVAELNQLIETIEQEASKSNSVYKGILSKKAEIDELHREIIGYDDEGEDGEIVSVDGLKTELEFSYSELETRSEELRETIDEIRSSTIEAIKKFVKDKTVEYDEVIKKIKTLLPDAMTAGLSSAFVKKKKEEQETLNEYKKRFNNGIFILIVVSILPIAVSLYFLYTGIPISEVLDKMPKIVIAFLPLYIPILWSTFSANKKINLSKRLIEEYSHKQVLSMTIEGLSNQIENIDDTTVSNELRNQLLFNFLTVSSENPGKLISNYQYSDHPILEILDRRKKKSGNGDDTITAKIENRSKSIVDKVADEIEDGIMTTVKSSLPSE